MNDPTGFIRSTLLLEKKLYSKIFDLSLLWDEDSTVN